MKTEWPLLTLDNKKEGGLVLVAAVLLYGRFRSSRIVTTLIMATNTNKVAMAGKK